MTIQVEIAPDKETRLQEEARRAGVPVSDYVNGLLDRHLSGTPPANGSDDWATLMEALAEGSENRPVLPEGAFQRDNYYGERG